MHVALHHSGKTTVARLYGKFLASVGALPGSFFVETTGSRLANEGVSGCKKQIEEILSGGGGAMFIDEAYQLASGHNHGGRQVLDFLLAEVENLTGKVVFILAGYNKQMEEFFAHNPGLPSRFPHELQFKDYTDTELLQILGYQINKKYNRRMNVDGGMGGLYARVVARRVGRGRGREGFGNARAVANAFARITERQAKRLQRERRAGLTPDDLLLTKEDLLGPEPSTALKGNESWSKLQSLIGLSTVKQSVQALFDSLHLNYYRELEEQPLLEYSLNRVFLGSPGTGKTSVAKLYGQILADIGLLSSGQGELLPAESTRRKY
jgi:Cdc6-like AAA superfamily ATPase